MTDKCTRLIVLCTKMIVLAANREQESMRSGPMSVVAMREDIKEMEEIIGEMELQDIKNYRDGIKQP